MGCRSQVLEGFREDYTYSHVLPFEYTNFIDGMAWVSTLWGAALLVGDDEIAAHCGGFIWNLLEVGPDARNFAPFQVKSSWVMSPNQPGYWFKRKPQSFAGPAALRFAINQGADIEPSRVVDVRGQAKVFRALAWPFGYLIRYVKPLRQHINSVMFAHLIAGARPPKSMHFLAHNNPLYSWLYKERCEALYLNTGPWPAKDYPGNAEIKTQTYTPVCQLAAEYLQSTL